MQKGEGGKSRINCLGSFALYAFSVGKLFSSVRKAGFLPYGMTILLNRNHSLLPASQYSTALLHLAITSMILSKFCIDYLVALCSVCLIPLECTVYGNGPFQLLSAESYFKHFQSKLSLHRVNQDLAKNCLAL